LTDNGPAVRHHRTVPAVHRPNGQSGTPKPTGDAGPQTLLHAIASYYSGDPRVRAVAVYGSLARGNWDEYSDADVAVVVDDAVRIDAAWVAEEVARLCEARDLRPAVLRAGSDEGDLVLPLPIPMHVGIQYRPLRLTSPFLADNMLLLAGPLDEDAIRAASDANRSTTLALQPRSLPQILSTCLLNATGADLRIHRDQYWRAYECLFGAAQNLAQLFTYSRGGTRPLPVFESQADAALKARMGKALPAYEPLRLQEALLALLDLLEHDLETIGSGRVQLSKAQRQLISLLRQRQEDLHLGTGAHPAHRVE